VLDLLFGLLLMAAVAHPIIKVRQWQQLAVLSKLVIIVAGNGLFYLGALGYLENVVHLALYGALYLIISLIMLIGRRVIPFFIERGVEEKVKLRQHRWLDISILLFFVLFFINELFIGRAEFTLFSAGLLFLLNSLRLFNWHTPGIWQAPLLWGLYVSSWLINAGFLLMALQYWLPISGILTVHLFTIGGIGLMTLSMMSRVALGHSGRNIRQPPALVGYALGLLVLSAVFRKRIFENVSKEAWAGWLKHQTMLVNENRLSLADPQARKYLAQQTEAYFFGTGADAASGYVPPKN